MTGDGTGGAGREPGGSIGEILERRGAGDRERARAYNFAYLDEDTKREIRRALLKAVAVPGLQVPFAGREMPMPYGWGTGGIQVTASIIGPDDVLKVIDQGSDDTTNAVSIRAFHRALTGVETTTATDAATIIQTRHRIPETPLKEGQIMVYQVPLPEPMRQLEPSELETRTLHALEEYGTMYLKLYEDVARHKEIAISFDYPVMVAGRYAASPSPIPRFDNPKLDGSPALHLFGAGRERRVYAIPPYTGVKSFDFSDYPFRIQSWDRACALCGASDSYLDEIVTDDQGGRMFACSDTDHCRRRLERVPGPGEDAGGGDGSGPPEGDGGGRGSGPPDAGEEGRESAEQLDAGGGGEPGRTEGE
jgi:alpha-D-ribose 1-methylphosphonate 5-phosphate C-P lyase